jgi:hypothetical protein
VWTSEYPSTLGSLTPLTHSVTRSADLRPCTLGLPTGNEFQCGCYRGCCYRAVTYRHRTAHEAQSGGVVFGCAQNAFGAGDMKGGGTDAKVTPLAAPTSAPGLGSPLPHLLRDWAHPSHIYSGTWLAPATSAPGLGSPLPHLLRVGLGSPLPHLLRDGLGSPLPHLLRDWARPCHICSGTGLAPATSMFTATGQLR